MLLPTWIIYITGHGALVKNPQGLTEELSLINEKKEKIKTLQTVLQNIPHKESTSIPINMQILAEQLKLQLLEEANFKHFIKQSGAIAGLTMYEFHKLLTFFKN